MAALVNAESRRRLRQPRTVVLLGVDLRNAKEENFVRMVCDGLSLSAAFEKAGFMSKATDAPYHLFHKPHIQERAAAILEARKSQGVITLPEVTDMLKRVFAGALHDGEYSAAHNAAFSLARLYGHVTDKATLEVIRRPSRDPDAPSEMALGDWIADLPAVNAAGLSAGLAGPSPSPGLVSGPAPAEMRDLGRVFDAPVAPLGQGPGPQSQNPNDINAVARLGPSGPAKPLTIEGELSNEINWLRAASPQGPSPERGNVNEINGINSGTTPGRPENGAPTPPVTGTPDTRAQSELLGPEPVGYPAPAGVGGIENGSPRQQEQVPVFSGENIPAKLDGGPAEGGTEIPSAEDLFG